MEDWPSPAGGDIGLARFFIDAAILVAQLVYGDQATFCHRRLRTAGHSQAEQ